MANRTPVDKLADAISGILDQYEGEVCDNLGEITTQIGKKGVQALRRASKGALKTGSGKYARGWKTQVEKGRLGTTVIIYNEHPGLPHLLEYGHVSRNGTGRTYGEVPGHEHIQPVAEELVRDFERKVVEAL
jgi:hypothetical protein